MKKAPILLLVGALASSAQNGPLVSKAAPELALMGTNGKIIQVADYRAKVVMLAFLSSTCPHCKALSKNMELLEHEFGPGRFQAIGALVDQGADPNAFVRQQGLTFPVGVAPRSAFPGFLGYSPDTRTVTPNVVLIDANGVVRAQSDRLGSPDLQDPKTLRAEIQALIDPKGAGPAAATLRAAHIRRFLAAYVFPVLVGFLSIAAYQLYSRISVGAMYGTKTSKAAVFTASFAAASISLAGWSFIIRSPAMIPLYGVGVGCANVVMSQVVAIVLTKHARFRVRYPKVIWRSDEAGRAELAAHMRKAMAPAPR